MANTFKIHLQVADDDLQQACLDGKPLDDKMAFEDMGSIVRVLQ